MWKIKDIGIKLLARIILNDPVKLWNYYDLFIYQWRSNDDLYTHTHKLSSFFLFNSEFRFRNWTSRMQKLCSFRSSNFATIAFSFCSDSYHIC